MRSLLLAMLAVALVACGDDDETVTTTLQTSTSPPSATAATAVATNPPSSTVGETVVADSMTTAVAPLPPDAVVPEGFDQVAATVTAADGTVCELCLWLAATGDQRALGLMYATDLGGPDGMVFRYDAPTTAAFWMKNTVMPLSIAFFDEGGAYLDAFDMQPCTADPCALYATPTDFVDAIEAPLGRLASLGIGPGSVLAVGDLPCS